MKKDTLYVLLITNCMHIVYIIQSPAGREQLHKTASDRFFLKNCFPTSVPDLFYLLLTDVFSATILGALKLRLKT